MCPPPSPELAQPSDHTAVPGSLTFSLGKLAPQNAAAQRPGSNQPSFIRELEELSCVIASISSEDVGQLMKNIIPSDIWIVIFPMTLISFRGIDEFCLLADILLCCY